MNTEITLPAIELKEALGGLGKLVNRKSTLPVLGCVKVSRQKNGQVTLQATDLDGYATYHLNDTQPGELCDVLVPLEHLTKAMKSNTKQPVVLLGDGKTTKLRFCLGDSPVTQPVNTIPANEWPPVPEITAEGTPLQPGFGEALRQAMVCCSDDPSRQVLHGACLDARDPKAHYIVGTNGRFLFAANSFTFPLKESVIIPDSKFINGSCLLDGEPCFLSIQPGKTPDALKHICLHNKRWQFVTREINGNYPNWKQAVPETQGWTKVKLSEAAIDQLLKVIPNLPGKDTQDQVIRLRMEHNALVVEGRGKDDKEWTSVPVTEVTIDGKAKEISLNREYLLPALKFGLSELHIQDELTPLVCSHGGKRIVIMPVRPHGPPQPTTTKPVQPNPVTPPASTPAPERKPDMSKTAAPESKASPSLLDQIEQLKESARNLVRDLSGLTDAVKQMDKDKRQNEKELENARAVLKKLQQVTI